MQDISQVEDLLVSYDPVHTKSQEQAYPLETMAEPVSGGDAYYEDFTDGLRRFTQARLLTLGGADAAALIMSIGPTDGKGTDPMNDSSDDELDVSEAFDSISRISSPAEESILAFTIGTDREAPNNVKGGTSAATAPEASPITNAIVDKTAADEEFCDDVKSLLVFMKQAESPSVKDIPEGWTAANGRYDGGNGDVIAGDSCGGQSAVWSNGDSTFDDDKNSDAKSATYGAMDETEQESTAYDGEETILSAIVNTSDKTSA